MKNGNIAVYRNTSNRGVNFDVTKGTGTIAIVGRSQELRPDIGVDSDGRVGLNSTYVPEYDEKKEGYRQPLEREGQVRPPLEIPQITKAKGWLEKCR